MKNELIVVVDLGCFKAYKLVCDDLGSTPQMSCLEEFTTVAHQKLSEIFSDVPGRFRGGNPSLKAIKAYGEKHTIETEQEKRIIKQFSKRIDQLLKAQSDCRYWHLAASKEINREVVAQLDPNIRERMKTNLSEDLTKMPDEELLDHFATLRIK